MLKINGESFRTWREVIQDILNTVHDLDEPALLRIVQRRYVIPAQSDSDYEEFGPVVRVKNVKIGLMCMTDGTLRVEWSDIEKSNWRAD